MSCRTTQLLAVGISALVITFAAAGSAEATMLWDVADDWSDSSNTLVDSNPWSYEQSSGNLLEYHLDYWLPSNLGGNQPAWNIDGDNGHVPGLAKATGNAPSHDLPAGEVFGHASYGIRWTAPVEAKIYIRGSVWMPRDLDRLVGITLKHVYGGSETIFFGGVAVPERDQGITSSNPFTFSDAVIAAGGDPSVLDLVSVQPGDSILLLGSGGDFLGARFAMYIPEPGSIVLLGTALLAVIVCAWRRRKKGARSRFG